MFPGKLPSCTQVEAIKVRVKTAKVVIRKVGVGSVFVHEQWKLITVWHARRLESIGNNYLGFGTNVFVVFRKERWGVVGKFFAPVFNFEPGVGVLFVGEG